MSDPTLQDVAEIAAFLLCIQPRSELRMIHKAISEESGLALIARTLQALAEHRGEDVANYASYAVALQNALRHVNLARAERAAILAGRRDARYPAGCGATRDSDFATISNACEHDTRGTDLLAALDRLQANDEDRANELRIGLGSFEQIAKEMDSFGAFSHARVIELVTRSLRATFGLGDDSLPTAAMPPDELT